MESLVSPGLEVTFDNAMPPLITSGVLLSAIVGQPYVVDLAHPEEGVSLTYAATTFPAGLTINPQTGQIAWTPKVDQSGNQALTLQYTDLAGNTTTQDFSIDVQVVTYVDLVAFAKALRDAGTKLYGSVWDPFTNQQKALFGDGARYLPFIEVTTPSRDLNQLVRTRGLQISRRGSFRR